MALKILEDAIQLTAELNPTICRIARRDRDLARQLQRALNSTALNIAEGEQLDDGRARTHFRIAMGSANESITALRLAEGHRYVGSHEGERNTLDRIARSLRRLLR